MINDLLDITSFKWATVTSTDPLLVQLDGDLVPLNLIPDSLIDPYTLMIGDRVRVELTLRKLVIHGRANGIRRPFPIQTDLVLQNGWNEYDLPGTGWTYGKYGKTVDGIVVLNGLIIAGTTAANTLLATLPPGYRPDYRTVFTVNNSDSQLALDIYPDGRIQLGSAVGTGTYVSLAGIAFPAAGVASWTAVGNAAAGSIFQNSWVDYGVAEYGPARFWKDKYGMVWLQGLIKSGSTAADNTPMFTLPSSFIAKRYNHIITGSSSGFGYIGVDSAGSGLSGASSRVLWKSGTASSGWVTLSGAVYESTTSTIKWTTLPLVNSYSLLGPGVYTAAEYANINGLVLTHGMLNNYNANIAFFWGIGDRPGAQQGRGAVFNRVAAAARGRMDVNRNIAPQQGGGAAVFGVNGNWFSLDSLMFLAES